MAKVRRERRFLGLAVRPANNLADCPDDEKGAHRGPLLRIGGRAGRSAADGDHGQGDGEAEAQDERGGQTVEKPFDPGETCESHDTHL